MRGEALTPRTYLSLFMKEKENMGSETGARVVGPLGCEQALSLHTWTCKHRGESGRQPPQGSSREILQDHPYYACWIVGKVPDQAVLLA